MEKWKREFIKYLFPYSAHQLKIEAAMAVKHPHVPSQLYKYRRFTEQHREALAKGVLWRCSPDRFNDPYDSAVYFDPTRFLVEDQPIQEFLASMNEATGKIDAGTPWHPAPIQRPVQQRVWRRREHEALLKNTPEDVRVAVLAAVDAWHDKFAKEAVQLMSNLTRTGFSVLSLTPNPTSVLMWSHYSENHSGFCVEYDLTQDHFLHRICFPVYYRRKLTDATRYLARQDPKDFNNLFGGYVCLLKSDEWAYEQEWRLVLPTGSTHANSEMTMPKPSAIIVGARVQADHKKWMQEFCYDTGVPMKCITHRHNEFRLEIVDADSL
jgi:hypothetical protein